MNSISGNGSKVVDDFSIFNPENFVVKGEDVKTTGPSSSSQPKADEALEHSGDLQSSKHGVLLQHDSSSPLNPSSSLHPGNMIVMDAPKVISSSSDQSGIISTLQKIEDSGDSDSKSEIQESSLDDISFNEDSLEYEIDPDAIIDINPEQVKAEQTACLSVVKHLLNEKMDLTKPQHMKIAYFFRAISNFFAKVFGGNISSIGQDDLAAKTKSFISTHKDAQLFLKGLDLPTQKAVIKEALTAQNGGLDIPADKLETYADTIAQTIATELKATFGDRLEPTATEAKIFKQAADLAGNFVKLFDDLAAQLPDLEDRNEVYKFVNKATVAESSIEFATTLNDFFTATMNFWKNDLDLNTVKGNRLDYKEHKDTYHADLKDVLPDIEQHQYSAVRTLSNQILADYVGMQLMQDPKKAMIADLFFSMIGARNAHSANLYLDTYYDNVKLNDGLEFKDPSTINKERQEMHRSMSDLCSLLTSSKERPQNPKDHYGLVKMSLRTAFISLMGNMHFQNKLSV